MPKPYTNPTLIDNCLVLNVKVFKQTAYLKNSDTNTGTLSWSRNGVKSAEIAFKIIFSEPTPSIHLKYNYNGTPISTIIHTVSVPSNLGKSNFLYFICPRTGNRCRKLYLHYGYFVHRKAVNGYYTQQAESKYYRLLGNTEWGKDINIENLMLQTFKKHFKKSYAGKPTRKYSQIQKKIHRIKTSYTIPFY